MCVVCTSCSGESTSSHVRVSAPSERALSRTLCAPPAAADPLVLKALSVLIECHAMALITTAQAKMENQEVFYNTQSKGL